MAALRSLKPSTIGSISLSCYKQLLGLLTTGNLQEQIDISGGHVRRAR